MDFDALSQFLSPANLALAVVFIVPGWVALETYSALVPSEKRNFGEELIRLVAVSLLNFLLFFVIAPLGLQRVPQSLADVRLVDALRLLLALVVTPALLAGATYFLRNRKSFSRFVVQPEPTAWDFTEKGREGRYLQLAGELPFPIQYNHRDHG